MRTIDRKLTVTTEDWTLTVWTQYRQDINSEDKKRDINSEDKIQTRR